MQFFLYYVLSPLILGFMALYTLVLLPGWTIPLTAVWLFAWVVWPLGSFRREFIEEQYALLEEDLDEEGEIPMGKAMILSVGPTFVLLLSVLVGVQSAPLILENVMGVDIKTVLKEREKDE